MNRMLTIAQIGYLCAGIGYNLVSLARRLLGLATLAPTNPLFGLLMMGVLTGTWLLGRSGYRRLAALMLALLVCLMARTVVNHFSALGGGWRVGYASYGAALLAGCINSVGVAVFGSQAIRWAFRSDPGTEGSSI